MTQRTAAAMLAMCLAIGCGGDDDGGAGADAAAGGADARQQADAASSTCAEAPSGTVNGTVDAEMIDPIAAAYSRPHPTLAYAHIVQIDEDPASSCDNPDGDGDTESLQFIFCAEPEIGQYDVVGADDFPGEACPGERVVGAQVQSGNGADRGVGDSGTVTIESIDTCLRASFTVGFDTGNLDGDVVAEVCQ
jgi:hypothetical protein